MRVAVFTGPEEDPVDDPVRLGFPSSTIVADRLPIPEFAAAVERLTLLVSNDTGPMHVTAAVGTPVVVLLGRTDWDIYVPRGDRHQTVRGNGVMAIEVEAVFAAARATLKAGANDEGRH